MKTAQIKKHSRLLISVRAGVTRVEGERHTFDRPQPPHHVTVIPVVDSNQSPPTSRILGPFLGRRNPLDMGNPGYPRCGSVDPSNASQGTRDG
ncbi:hypothetical protein E2C01_018301 [Portunus trituberculatus]|uniref:Uncharacterized protein n=1 Tax=Portunus trituberculatus TaxID=210409 RepID=A0A5B7DUS2_PORTR|nr:hypothetical protein [Portunus trituberculatus]